MLISFGVFLLILCLFYYTILMFTDQIDTILSNFIAKQTEPNTILVSLKKSISILQTEKLRTISGYAALLIALWNFFAPNFGDPRSMTIIGSLIPSIVLFMNALLLAPELLSWISFNNTIKEKLELLINKFGMAAGWITLLTAILHTLFPYMPFL